MTDFRHLGLTRAKGLDAIDPPSHRAPRYVFQTPFPHFPDKRCAGTVAVGGTQSKLAKSFRQRPHAAAHEP